MIAAVQAGAAAPEPGSEPEQVRAILSEPLPDDAYVQSRNCIGLRQLRSTEVLDSRHVLFYGARGRVWLNQLHQACFGLGSDRALSFSVMGANLCRMDRFRALDRVGMTAGRFSGECLLGDFEPLTAGQALMIREALARRSTSVLQPLPDEEAP